MTPVFGRCDKCACWQRNYADPNLGACLRRSPLIVQPRPVQAAKRAITVWPETAAYEGCWDHIPKETKP